MALTLSSDDLLAIANLVEVHVLMAPFSVDLIGLDVGNGPQTITLTQDFATDADFPAADPPGAWVGSSGGAAVALYLDGTLWKMEVSAAAGSVLFSTLVPVDYRLPSGIAYLSTVSFGTWGTTNVTGSGAGFIFTTFDNVKRLSELLAAVPADVWDEDEAVGLIAQANKITTGNIVVADRVGRALTRIVKGDSYTADRVLRYPMPEGADWPADLTGWSVMWTATKRPGNTSSGDATLSVAGVVATPTGDNRLVTVALTAAQTAALAAGVGNRGYKLELLATNGLLKAHLWLSLLTVDE